MILLPENSDIDELYNFGKTQINIKHSARFFIYWYILQKKNTMKSVLFYDIAFDFKFKIKCLLASSNMKKYLSKKHETQQNKNWFENFLIISPYSLSNEPMTILHI